jgi:hypothetical protein
MKMKMMNEEDNQEQELVFCHIHPDVHHHQNLDHFLLIPEKKEKKLKKLGENISYFNRTYSFSIRIDS